MKSKFGKIFAIVLAISVFLSCFGVSSSALMATDEWKTYYSDYLEDGYAVYMNPGSDESQRNFSWYSPLNADKCKVVVSESDSFTNIKIFYGSYVVTPEGDRSNKITVSGLEQGKTYYYRCFIGGNLIKEACFKTDSGKSFTALYTTDIHISRKDGDMENPIMNESYTLDQVLTEAKTKGAYNLIISSGDQASYGDRREYTGLVASPIFDSVPISLCVGNHDRKGIAYKYFNNNPNKNQKGVSSFIGNDYWYVKGDVLFLVMDSNNSAAASHRSFVKAAVKANPDVKWKVAVMHHDLYGRLTDGRLEDSNENRRPAFISTFDEFGIDLVFLGHSHYYSVSNGLVNGEVTDKFDGNNTIKDAKGTVYIVSNSINHPRSVEDAESITPTEGNAVAIQLEGPTYNIVDFSENSISVRSYGFGADEPFNSFTIEKTSQNGGHEEHQITIAIWFKNFIYDFGSFWTEIGEGLSGCWKNFFDK